MNCSLAHRNKVCEGQYVQDRVVLGHLSDDASMDGIDGGSSCPITCQC